MNSTLSWNALEHRVRTLASYIWNAKATAEEIHGVRFDAVLRLDSDRFILIEVTQTITLSKLRSDIAKFSTTKQAFLADGIHTKCYFVTPTDPPPSIVQTASAQRITALSVAQLEKLFFDYERYHYVRSSKPFGSAVDLLSGEKDKQPYVPVTYSASKRNKAYIIRDLANALCNGKKIILLGNYGTGKSRCIQELFSVLGELAAQRHLYPLAVDLREHWGLRRRSEIIRRHFDDIGISDGADSTLRVVDTGAVVLLLDGFDEIASQVWSDDPKKLEEIRTQSLTGVADLIRSSRGGVLVAGREHYFNSKDEMFRCLGMDPRKTLVISCAEEFSDEQMTEFLQTVREDLSIPNWLPRRPLVSRMLAGFEADALDALSRERAETDFWTILLDTICTREARIHPSLDSSNIRNILLRLSDLSRRKPNNVGPISVRELNEVFEEVVGRPPRDEASAMIQRLPVLGRIDASTSDRQFLDTYILDGLRATSVSEMAIVGPHVRISRERWIQHLGPFGQSILTQSIADHGNAAAYLPFLRELSTTHNRILAGDILTALLGIEEAGIDFRHLNLFDTHLGIVNLADTPARNIRVAASFIDELTVGGAVPIGLIVDGCWIDTLRGLSSSDQMPEWIVEPEVGRFDALTNVAKIRQAKLSKKQEVFVTVVHKTFFQPGSGRKEEALLRGLGAARDRKIARRVLGMLIEEGVLTKFSGDEGLVYVPARKHTKRMGMILSQLENTSDPLWARL